MARKEKQFHYLYKITNTKNGKYYIGMHSTYNTDDGYMGGGKRITNSVRKHGKEAHTKEILEYFDDRESLRQREIELVNEDLLKDPMCMNLQPGGGGGWSKDTQIELGRRSRERQKWLMENDQEYSKRRRIQMSITMSENSRKMWEDPEKAEKLKKSAAVAFLDRSHTDEAKKAIGDKNSISQKGEKNSQYGKCWIYNTEYEKNIRIQKGDIEYYVSIGWRLGMKMKYF